MNTLLLRFDNGSVCHLNQNLHPFQACVHHFALRGSNNSSRRRNPGHKKHLFVLLLSLPCIHCFSLTMLSIEHSGFFLFRRRISLLCPAELCVCIPDPHDSPHINHLWVKILYCTSLLGLRKLFAVIHNEIFHRIVGACLYAWLMST